MRWEPNARGRLAQAAMELYGERGFEETTVAEIAKRAGLTERTFFRHFADKREVLFSGSELLVTSLAEAVVEAPDSAGALEAVAAALDVFATMLEGRRDFARQRQRIIEANVDLQERELIKMALLSAAIADALRQRGVADPTARLAAEAGIAVFRTAFARWVEDAEGPDLPQVTADSLAELRALAAAPAAVV
jgi:AcrR family transcriptional regulator